MFLRDAPEHSLKDIRDQLETDMTSVSAISSEIEINLTADDPTIKIGDIELPATKPGILALGAQYDVPSKYLERIDAELQQFTLSHLLGRKDEAHTIIYTDAGIREVIPQTIEQIDHRRIVDIATRVIGTDEAMVTDFWKESGRDFRLDVVVPEGYELGWGGDRKVGDLTGAGLRFEHNLKPDTFHAPAVSLMLYRLACTNGYEDVDETAKVDARGSTLDEVLKEYEWLADRLFKRAEEKINAFYEMRSTRVEHPEQRILRHADEWGIPARISNDMIARVPEFVADSEDSHFTEFDLVNLFTNQANAPSVKRDTAKRKLHRLGGTLIGEHSSRCTHCQSKLLPTDA